MGKNPVFFGIEELKLNSMSYLDLDEFRFKGYVAVTLGAAQFLWFFGHVSWRLDGGDALDLGGSDRQLGKNARLFLRFLELLL